MTKEEQIRIYRAMFITFVLVAVITTFSLVLYGTPLFPKVMNGISWLAILGLVYKAYQIAREPN